MRTISLARPIALLAAFFLAIYSGRGTAADSSSKTTDQQTGSDASTKTDSSGSQSKGSTTPSVTVGSNTGVIESYVLADVGLRSCASKIVASVPSSVKTLVVFDQTQRDMLAALTSFQIDAEITSSALTSAVKGYDDLPPLPDNLSAPAGAAGAGLPTVTPIVDALTGAITNLVGLFRTDVTIGGTVLTLDDELVVDEVSRAAIKAAEPRAVFKPSVYFADVFDPSAVTNSKVVSQLTDLYTLRNKAQVRILDLQSSVTDLTTRLKAAKTDTQRSTIKQYLNPRVAALDSLKAAAAVFDAVMALVISPPKQPATTPTPAPAPAPAPAPGAPLKKKPASANNQDPNTAGDNIDKQSTAPPKGTDQQTAAPTLATLVMAELWRKKFVQTDVGLILLHTHVAGGGYEAKSNIWTFLGGARFSYSGGSVSSFSVISAKDGNVLTSGSCPAYTGFVRGPEVTKGASAPLP
jgi:hypothetical protein